MHQALNFGLDDFVANGFLVGDLGGRSATIEDKRGARKILVWGGIDGCKGSMLNVGAQEATLLDRSWIYSFIESIWFLGSMVVVAPFGLIFFSTNFASWVGRGVKITK